MAEQDGKKPAAKALRVRPKPVIDEKQCIGCSMCLEHCPLGCLELRLPDDEDAIQEVAFLAQAEKCSGCGMCFKVCPADAVTMTLPDGTITDQRVTVTRRKKMAKKLYVAANRAVQYTFKGAFYALPFREPTMIKGEGASLKLADLLKKKRVNNILFVTDPTLMKIGLAEPILKALEEGGVRYSLFYDIEQNPTNENVEDGYAVYAANGCQGLVALGGGAPMDCAKGIAARAVHPKMSVKMLMGLFRVLKKIPPFIAIPTTAGTGSETTVAAVITDAVTHHKATMMDTALIPAYAILDPALTVGLPPFVTATTGIDALTHAVEAYTNHTYNTLLEDRYSKKAVRLIHDNLYKVYQDGTDIKARLAMQEAAFYAGRAFTRGCVGYVHAVGHTLGGLYGVPHGLAMSIILPHMLRSYGAAVYDRLADLADVIDLPGDNNKEKAENFIKWIEQMKKDMGIPEKLDMIEDEDVDQIVAWAIHENNPIYPTPLIYNKKELKKIVQSLRAK